MLVTDFVSHESLVEYSPGPGIDFKDPMIQSKGSGRLVEPILVFAACFKGFSGLYWPGPTERAIFGRCADEVFKIALCEDVKTGFGSCCPGPGVSKL
jgi:hypothetical protein